MQHSTSAGRTRKGPLIGIGGCFNDFFVNLKNEERRSRRKKTDESLKFVLDLKVKNNIKRI